MIHTLRIDGYRGFGRFEMDGLGRLNLLVGRNNSGKTSVLEALHILSSAGDPFATIWQHCRRRGETLAELREMRYPSFTGRATELDVAHLFSGNELQSGSSFSISARNQGIQRSVTFTIDEPNEREPDLLASTVAEEGNIGLVLRISTIPAAADPIALPLSRRGSIPLNPIDLSFRRRIKVSRAANRDSVYVSTESLSSEELVHL